MTNRVKVAAIGVGNDISALVQGIALHRATGSLVGIHRSVLDGLSVGDIDFVAAFATSPEKIGKASPMPPRLIALPGSLPGLR